MAALGTSISSETPMNEGIVGALFIRKNYGREIHGLMFRALHLDMGKKVKEPGHKIHDALPLVLILRGADCPLAGEMNCRDVSVSCVVTVLLLLKQCPVSVCNCQNCQLSFQCCGILCCCQMKAMLSTHTQNQMASSFGLLLSEVKMRTALILQFKFPPPPNLFNFLSASFRHLPM